MCALMRNFLFCPAGQISTRYNREAWVSKSWWEEECLDNPLHYRRGLSVLILLCVWFRDACSVVEEEYYSNLYSGELDANCYGTKNITVSSLSMCSYKMVQFVSYMYMYWRHVLFFPILALCKILLIRSVDSR